jgi:hypothetical protein
MRGKNMRPSLALSIGAAFSILIGLPLVLAPAQVLSVLGSAMPTEGLVPARDVGVLLTGVGIIDWLARDAVGAPLRGLLWGNIFIRAVEMVVNVWEIAAGLLVTTMGGASLAATLGLNIALIAMFALAVRRA